MNRWDGGEEGAFGGSVGNEADGSYAADGRLRSD
jgi:hypothetical protein